MIVKINRPTRSFHDAADYLLHDKPAHKGDRRPDIDLRVGWIETRNCRHERGFAAVAEMANTALRASDLKTAAGLRPGRPLENPVKTLSLSWQRSQRPSRAEMVEAADSFLAFMGWSEHQALIVAHTDTAHPHLHILINRVHPVRGTALDDRHDFVRAALWSRTMTLEPIPSIRRAWPPHWQDRRVLTRHDRIRWRRRKLEVRAMRLGTTQKRREKSQAIRTAVRQGQITEAWRLSRSPELASPRPRRIGVMPPGPNDYVARRSSRAALEAEFRFLWSDLTRALPKFLWAGAAAQLRSREAAERRALDELEHHESDHHRALWRQVREAGTIRFRTGQNTSAPAPYANTRQKHHRIRLSSRSLISPEFR